MQNFGTPLSKVLLDQKFYGYNKKLVSDHATHSSSVEAIAQYSSASSGNGAGGWLQLDAIQLQLATSEVGRPLKRSQ